MLTSFQVLIDDSSFEASKGHSIEQAISMNVISIGLHSTHELPDNKAYPTSKNPQTTRIT